jgi:hypothetical protein
MLLSLSYFLLFTFNIVSIMFSAHNEQTDKLKLVESMKL